MPRIRTRELPSQVEKVGDVLSLGTTFCLKFRRIGEKTWESVKNQEKNVLETQRDRWKASILIGPSGKRIVQTELSDAQLSHAEMAFSLMRQKGWFQDDEDAHNLLDLVNHSMIRQGLRKGESPLLVDCIETFLQVKRERLDQGRLRKPTFSELERILKKDSASLANTYPAQRISQVAAKDLAQLIGSKRSDSLKQKFRTVLNNFYEFASGKHNQTPWLEKNPIRNIAKIDVQQGEVCSYSFADVVQLLKTAHQQKQLAYFVFRLFTLARREETLKLIKIGGSDISANPYIAKGHVKFSREMVKTKKEQQKGGRTVPIDDTLKKWLTYFKKKKIPLWYRPKREVKVRAAIADKFGKGFANIVRHASITFHAKRYRNTDKTAQLAGHTILMLWDRYYNYHGVTEDEAKKLYKLTPSQAANLGIL